MQILFLAFVLLAIIGLLALRRPLWQALLGGLVLLWALFRIAPADGARLFLNPIAGWSSLSVILVVYLIAFLQRVLDARGMLRGAQQDLDALFHNRRINASGAPVFIGLLPSAAAMLLCADIVREATDGSLTPEEQAFTASWFRHIPESILPTYTGVILMLSLTGLPAGPFMLAMIPPVCFLALLGFLFVLRKVPGRTGQASGGAKLPHLAALLRHLWPLLLILVLILAFGMDVSLAVLVSIVCAALILRLTPAELSPMFRDSFEWKILLSTYLVLVLKEFIAATGVLETLPQAMGTLPLPAWLVFAVLFFVATLIGGTTSAIALGTPLAFAALPGSIPLAVYLMCITHAACQLSPVHVCLAVAAESFRVSLGSLIRRTLPVALSFCVLMTVYYHLLNALL